MNALFALLSTVVGVTISVILFLRVKDDIMYSDKTKLIWQLDQHLLIIAMCFFHGAFQALQLMSHIYQGFVWLMS